MKLFAAFVGVLVLWGTTVNQASATYFLQGNEVDLSEFVGMLNDASTGGTWGRQVPGPGLPPYVLTFSSDGTQKNLFASLLLGYHNDTNAFRLLQIGRHIPRILVGGFRPTDVDKIQAIDLADIEIFPVTTVGNPWIQVQSGALLHELTEAYVDGGQDNYPNAHGALIGGIHDENSQFAAVGGKGLRLPDAGMTLCQVAANGTDLDCLSAIPWQEVVSGKNYYEIDHYLMIGAAAEDPNLVLRSITRGRIDSGAISDGTNQDIALQSVYRSDTFPPVASAPLPPWTWGALAAALLATTIGFAGRQARRLHA